jgi:hypothetical protein
MNVDESSHILVDPWKLHRRVYKGLIEKEHMRLHLPTPLAAQIRHSTLEFIKFVEPKRESNAFEREQARSFP